MSCRANPCRSNQRQRYASSAPRFKSHGQRNPGGCRQDRRGFVHHRVPGHQLAGNGDRADHRARTTSHRAHWLRTNLLAGGLGSKRTRLVAALVPSITNAIFVEARSGAHRPLVGSGLSSSARALGISRDARRRTPRRRIEPRLAHLERLLQARGRIIRGADRLDLALVQQLLVGAKRFLERRVLVVPVRLVGIDAVDPCRRRSEASTAWRM
jgi:hypothetical protein